MSSDGNVLASSSEIEQPVNSHFLDIEANASVKFWNRSIFGHVKHKAPMCTLRGATIATVEKSVKRQFLDNAANQVSNFGHVIEAPMYVLL